MKNFRNIVYSEVPPNINDLWLKGTLNPDDPFEIRIFKMGKWEVIDKGNLTLEDGLGDSENSTMTQKAITEALTRLQNQIDNINPNDFDFSIKPIENTGILTNVPATIVIQNFNEDGKAVLFNKNTNEEYILYNGENNVYINLTQEYNVRYTLDGISIIKDVVFNLTDPLFFGLYSDNITNLNSGILEGFNKVVVDSLEQFFSFIPNDKHTYFYIIIPEDKNAQLTSNGFFIPLTVNSKVPYLNKTYCIYKSGLLDEGPLTNINIKIIKK